LSCAALEAQFWLSLSFEARASNSSYEVEAQLKLRLKLKLEAQLISSSREEFSQKMVFSLNFTIIFKLDLTHLLLSERIHIKTGKNLQIFLKLTHFK